MKRIFKTVLCLGAIALILPGCQKDEPGKSEEPPKEANLLTFGFTEADNEGVIIQDYAGTITGTNVSVAMPKDVEKTALKAYFTVSPDATVTVDGKAQQSGATVNDFSAPVDYIVSNGDVNNKYTVTVTKEADYVWTKLPAFTETTPSDFVMKVNPVTGEPYVVFRSEVTRTGAAEPVRAAMVVKFSNGAWSFVGPKEGFSAGEVAGYLDITFDSKGNPYVVYPDNSDRVSVKGMATVQYFDGNEWKLVGEAGITTTQVQHSGIALMDNGNPMILTFYNKASDPIKRRELVVSTYSGSAWTTNQTIPGREAAKYGYYPNGALVNGTTYWAVYNQKDSAYSVYSYKAGTWTAIADGIVKEGTAAVHINSPFVMEVDNKENIYIGICDDADVNGTYKPRIQKYNSASKAWSDVGVIDIVMNGVSKFDLAVSPLRVPFVVYYNNTEQYPTVMYVDGDTKVWSEPVVLEDTAAEMGAHIDFDPNTGVGYVVYRVVSDSSLALWKYDRPAAGE